MSAFLLVLQIAVCETTWSTSNSPDLQGTRVWGTSRGAAAQAPFKSVFTDVHFHNFFKCHIEMVLIYFLIDLKMFQEYIFKHRITPVAHILHVAIQVIIWALFWCQPSFPLLHVQHPVSYFLLSQPIKYPLFLSLLSLSLLITALCKVVITGRLATTSSLISLYPTRLFILDWPSLPTLKSFKTKPLQMELQVLHVTDTVCQALAFFSCLASHHDLCSVSSRPNQHFGGPTCSMTLFCL